ncbi:MAG: hypothetical protein ACQETL_14780 [Bacteroidota bacterium]
MFFNRIFPQKSINWKYAIGEILLIFIGISLSLMFDQWKSDRLVQSREQEVINILIESIKNDTTDLEKKLSESKKTLHSIKYLINSLEENKGFNDSISFAFSIMGNNPQFEPDKLGYKTLMSEGIIIIADWEIRKKIIDYYSLVDSNIEWGENVGRHIKEYLEPRILTDFREYNFREKGIPFDYSQLQSDKVFLNALKRSERLNIVTIYRLSSQKKHANVFLKRLIKYKKNF